MGLELSEANKLTFAHHGAHRIRSAVSAATVDGIASAVSCLPPGNAGTKLHGITALRPLWFDIGVLVDNAWHASEI